MDGAGNTPVNRYGSIAAEIYDLDKPFGALRDTAYYLSLLEGLKGPILEPACGSGRTLVPLLEAGHDVTGFDASPEMIAQCEARCAIAGFSPDIRLGRFENFSYPTAFAAIVVPAASFTLVADFAPALDALQRFHDHLEPGGRLILDLDLLSFLAEKGEDRRCWTAANGDLLTIDGRRLSIDWLSQRETHRLRYERWRGGRLVETQLEPMARRIWGREEFTFALEATGFRDVVVTGNYRPRPPRSGDKILTFQARRP